MSDFHEKDLIAADIEAYLEKYRGKELCRFVAIGSVDDGKSTLIGRLLYDTGMVFEDQLEALQKGKRLDDGSIDLSLLTDGLTAEREQGITIDVAYRYFSTEKRKFIIADTPGHVQYTRNMVTGASTANVALILIDARKGVLEQSRRHAFVASLLGIPHLAVCINKMDLVDFSEAVFEQISADFRAYAESMKLSFKTITCFPVSAKLGDNCVEKSQNTPWYKGESVLEHLENVPVAQDRDMEHFRFPVQYVIRPNLDYRGFAGEIASGVVKKGDTLVVLPSGKSSKVKAIDVYEGELEEAFTPQSVTIRLEDEIDISRGDMLVHADDLPHVKRTFDAHVVWMHETPLDRQKSYLIKHTTQHVRAEIRDVQFKVDMASLENVPAETLGLNDIGRVTLACRRAVYFDPYRQNRATGAFIIVDSLTNSTVGAGMIVGERGEASQGLDAAMAELRAGSSMMPKTQVSPRERVERLGQKGATVWLTGLPGSGRWTLAYALERQLFDQGRAATVVDPTDASLDTMVTACKACTDAGLVTICAFPAYSAGDRDMLRERIGGDRVVQVFVDTDPELCKQRRPSANFDGFTAPENADVSVGLDKMRIDEAVKLIVNALAARGQF
ncbi:MAG: sulfate adenylyltransferase subunit CysN [Sandaracinaceae bacterium]|nr:sulfate adenylyltransferase subunit CysN [Sandaracinaceae bacterium]